MTRTLTVFRIGAILLIAALIATFAVATRPAAAQQGSGSAPLLFNFEGSVTEGPSKGTELNGELSLTPAADGTVSGALTIGDTAIPVTGRLAGTNISVTFDLGGGTYIFGIGRIFSDGIARGPFVGPASGDQGRWRAEPITVAAFDFSGTVNQGPSAGTTLAGLLTLKIADGHFTGDLDINGTKIPVAGRLTPAHDGTRINITFDLGNGVTIRGTGLSQADGSFAGPFRGPAAGDRGTWTATPAN